jgi:pimeloyl-ACP methyl ester carboxylesterase
MLRTSLAAAGALALLAFTPAHTQTPSDPPNDYSKAAAWLCWPGRDDACAGDNTASIVKADGGVTKETWKADPNAPIDCFYVYPTVSLDPGVISDMEAGPEEKRVVEQQLSRFGSKCRIYAPLYRQFTLTALRAAMTPGAAPPAARPNTGYQDVVDAWNHYLAHENKGRGVVLIGHSQGSGVLTQLIAEHIDGKPVQKQLVSALLLGTNLPVEKGKDTGTFKSIPLCKSPDQTGCALAYASFRDTLPPPPQTRFGRPRDPNSPMEAACTNPANLAGGKGELHAYLAASAMIAGSSTPPPVWTTAGTVDTPFVSVPGLLTAQCVSRNGFNYLEVSVNADPADPRTDDISGDVVANGQVLADWGLHLIDVNLAMGNLVDLVERQGKAWRAAN